MLTEAEDYTKLLPSEIYLLEKWDPQSSESLDVQRSRISRAYVALGVDGRWPYHQAAQTEQGYAAPTESQIQTLKAARTIHERNLACRMRENSTRVWLRLDYQSDFNPVDKIDQDAFPSAIVNWSQGVDIREFMLDDAARYSYESWNEVFNVLPEIVESAYPKATPQWFHDRLREDREDAENEIGLSCNTEDEEENEDWARCIRASTHRSAVTGRLWVYDQDTRDTGEMLFIWLDQYGRVVREVAMSPREIVDISSSFENARDNETTPWDNALEGEMYQDGNWP